MSLSYQDNKLWIALLPVLNEYTEWFHRLLYSVFYSEGELGAPNIRPVSFSEWILLAQKDKTIQPEIIERLSLLHSDLLKSHDLLLQSAHVEQGKPPHKIFAGFMTHYEEFLRHIRRLEKDLLLEGNGYDLFTGLRSPSRLIPDTKRELDRLARHGKGFCLALARIDDFDALAAISSEDEMNGYIRLVADLIKLSVRSFDDAYYLPNNEFVLCLKQTDVTGGISALERLRKQLEQQNVCYSAADGSRKELSISCCISEPVEGDDVNELLRHLRDDLSRSEQDSTDSSVLKYHELSPLQRYVQHELN